MPGLRTSCRPCQSCPKFVPFSMRLLMCPRTQHAGSVCGNIFGQGIYPLLFIVLEARIIDVFNRPDLSEQRKVQKTLIRFYIFHYHPCFVLSLKLDPLYKLFALTKNCFTSSSWYDRFNSSVIPSDSVFSVENFSKRAFTIRKDMVASVEAFSSVKWSN